MSINSDAPDAPGVIIVERDDGKYCVNSRVVRCEDYEGHQVWAAYAPDPGFAAAMPDVVNLFGLRVCKAAYHMYGGGKDGLGGACYYTDHPSVAEDYTGVVASGRDGNPLEPYREPPGCVYPDRN